MTTSIISTFWLGNSLRKKVYTDWPVELTRRGHTPKTTVDDVAALRIRAREISYVIFLTVEDIQKGNRAQGLGKGKWNIAACGISYYPILWDQDLYVNNLKIILRNEQLGDNQI